MNPFELFGMEPAPRPDPERLKARYLEEAERLHPDRIAGDGAEREWAGRRLAEWNGAYEVLQSPRLRLAFLQEWMTGAAPAKTGRVSGPGADRMMKVAEVCRMVDRLLQRRREARGAIEIAMMAGEMVGATQRVSALQNELADWQTELDESLRQLQEEWERGSRDPARVEALAQVFSYAEKAGRELEERFLKLAENLA